MTAKDTSRQLVMSLPDVDARDTSRKRVTPNRHTQLMRVWRTVRGKPAISSEQLQTVQAWMDNLQINARELGLVLGLNHTTIINKLHLNAGQHFFETEYAQIARYVRVKKLARTFGKEDEA